MARPLALATAVTPLAAAATFLLALPPTARAAEPRVLVVTETAGFKHDSIPAARDWLRRLGRRTKRFDTVFLSRARDLTSRRLGRARAVVFLNTSGELSLGKGGRSRLLRFVRDGGGLVGTHSATDTLSRWSDWGPLIGALFSHHPFTGTGRVIVEDGDHPATRGLGASFRMREEYYYFKSNPRGRAHVLARLDVASFGGDGSEDRPLVWCRREGEGRVFYDALGHFPATWGTKRQRRIVSGGLRWALGLEPAPACG